MSSRAIVALGALAAAAVLISSAMAAPNNGTRGSAQRKAYCLNQLVDCQHATDDYCKQHPEKGVYCESDGYAICNQQHSNCLAKAGTSDSLSPVDPNGLKHSP